VYNSFSKKVKGNLFLNPDEKEMNLKVWNNKESIIFSPLVSRSPVIKKGRCVIPKLEKILIDIFCQTKLLSPFQGLEMDQIFKFANEFYRINWKQAISYAKRRGKDEELLGYLNQLEIISKNQ
jgi:hypothetical protein